MSGLKRRLSRRRSAGPDGTEPPHRACIFRMAESIEMGQISPEPRSSDARITAGTGTIVERVTYSASPSLEERSAPLPQTGERYMIGIS